MKQGSTEGSFNNTGISVLKQYKLDSIDDGSDIEICVDSFVDNDPEDQCCELLLNKFRRQQFFYIWKIKTLSRSSVLLNSQEVAGIKLQIEQNSSSYIRRKRRMFLAQYSMMASTTIDRLKLSRLFSRWVDKYHKSRLERLQESFSEHFYQRKVIEKTFHPLRKSLIAKANSEINEISRTEQHLSPKSKTKELVNELHRISLENTQLERTISEKSDLLKDLQSRLRDLTAEEAEYDKKLLEINNATEQIQSSLTESEKQYQEEIANLRAQLSLTEKESSKELKRLSLEIKQQTAERESASAFVGDAQAAAKAELALYKERLEQAESVVKEFKELLASSEAKNQKLENTRHLLSAELENLKLRKKQIDISYESEKNSVLDKEEKMRQMLAQSQEELQIALAKIQAQDAQIKSKRQEIQLLKDEIERNRSRTAEAQSKFLRNSTPVMKGSPNKK